MMEVDEAGFEPEASLTSSGSISGATVTWRRRRSKNTFVRHTMIQTSMASAPKMIGSMALKMVRPLALEREDGSQQSGETKFEREAAGIERQVKVSCTLRGHSSGTRLMMKRTCTYDTAIRKMTACGGDE